MHGENSLLTHVPSGIQLLRLSPRQTRARCGPYSTRGDSASLVVNFVGGQHGNCSRTGSPDALAEEAHLLSAIRSAHRFRHLHEKLADLRSELGDRETFRA